MAAVTETEGVPDFVPVEWRERFRRLAAEEARRERVASFVVFTFGIGTACVALAVKLFA